MEPLNECSKRKSLVFVIPALQKGGAERVITSLANHFCLAGFACTIVALNEGPVAYPINSAVRIIYLVNRTKTNVGARAYYMLKTWRGLMSVLIKERPVCAISFITSANLWTGLACSVTGTRFIVSERTSPNRSIKKFNYVVKQLAAKVYQNSAAVVVGAKGVEECLRKNRGFEHLQNIERIINAVPQLGEKSGKQVHHRNFVLGVGRLSFVKGFDKLINAFAKARLTDTDLIIVGSGDELDNLTQLAVSLDVADRVILPGSKNNLYDYYSQAMMFVLPSRNEGYPNALVEAMSVGCACIATDCEFGPAEIIENGKNGLLVNVDSIQAMADAMTLLADDAELRNSISAQAIMINQTNSQQLVLQKWEKLVAG